MTTESQRHRAVDSTALAGDAGQPRARTDRRNESRQ
jgi:hypothetical protein